MHVSKTGGRKKEGTHSSVPNNGHGESKVRSRGGEKGFQEEVDEDIGVEEGRVELVAAV